jgi:polyhydroxyalkanoate synthesis regulator phasin
MFEQLRRLAMIGIGGTALAVDKVAEYVDELVKQGKLTVDEGKKLTEELIQNRKKDTTDEERKEIEEILLDMNLAQRKDIEQLETRIEQLETELNKAENDEEH